MKMTEELFELEKETKDINEPDVSINVDGTMELSKRSNLLKRMRSVVRNDHYLWQ